MLLNAWLRARLTRRETEPQQGQCQLLGPCSGRSGSSTSVSAVSWRSTPCTRPRPAYLVFRTAPLGLRDGSPYGSKDEKQALDHELQALLHGRGHRRPEYGGQLRARRGPDSLPATSDEQPAAPHHGEPRAGLGRYVDQGRAKRDDEDCHREEHCEDGAGGGKGSWRAGS